jgi:YfiH family protein
MTSRACAEAPLVDARLAESGASHGFDLREVDAAAGVVRPRQVHGATVLSLAQCREEAGRREADAVVSTTPGVKIGIVTADCVPLLLASRDGSAVAAVHAGWRGLARGVIGAGVRALVAAAGVAPADLLAGIGPHIGSCCYEVDAPVLDALRQRFAGGLQATLLPARSGHALLDLGALTRAALEREGLPPSAIGESAGLCTHCDPRRFHSHRRDGARAGRMLHYIAARPAEAGSPGTAAGPQA